MKTVKRPQVQDGLTGKITQISYSHDVKIGLPKYSSTGINLHMVAKVEEGDDYMEVLRMLTKKVHAEIEKLSDERKQHWINELTSD